MGTVGVILPAYKQPNLLIEAIYDVLRQKTEFNLKIVIADDDCPYAETKRVSESLAQIDSRVAICSRIANGGLSANRNVAIEYLLASCSDMEAITFLDADDRLDPGTLQSFYNQLTEAEPPAPGKRVGWVYTDPYQFGGIYGYLKKPSQYSPIWQLLANSNSATSLISVDVLHAGCRFDETMRRGSEDWDFWLQAIRKNFFGRFVKPPTFRYRRRPESMTSDATIHDLSIRSYVAERNSDLYSEGSVQEIAAADAARYAIFDASDTSQPKISYFLNVERSAESGIKSFLDALSPERRNKVSFYPQIAVIERYHLGASAISATIRDDIFLIAESALLKYQIMIVRKGEREQKAYIEERSRCLSIKDFLGENNGVYAIFITTEALVRLSSKYEQNIDLQILEVNLNSNLLNYTPHQRICEIALAGIIEQCGEAGLGRRDAFDYNPEWVPHGVCSRTVVNHLLAAKTVSPSFINRAHAIIAIDPRLLAHPQQKLQIYAAAKALRKEAYLTILCPRQHLIEEHINILSTITDRLISFSPDDIGVGEANTHYFGAAINHKMLMGLDRTTAGAMLGAKVVVVAGFFEIMSVAFSRKRKGSKLFVLDLSNSSADSSLPEQQEALNYAIGYEHAIDTFFTNDNRGMYLAASRGMPRDKLELMTAFQCEVESAFKLERTEA